MEEEQDLKQQDQSIPELQMEVLVHAIEGNHNNQTIVLKKENTPFTFWLMVETLIVS